MSDARPPGLRGPKGWVFFAFVGALIGLGLGALFPAARAAVGAAGLWADVPWILLGPFVLLLLCIALMPFISAAWWHDHYPHVSFFLGALVAGYCITSFGADGSHAVFHAAQEYYQFIALVFGLFAVSGGIVINVEARGRPLSNTIILAVGAVLANAIGTTGASMVLIRPFMRINAGRLRACHIVFFIFIVSNCGGCLTPVGYPPLYLGYIRGVPFFWTLTHLWKEWAVVNASLLAVFFVFDAVTGRGAPPAMPTIEVRPGAAAASEVVDLSKRVGFPDRIAVSDDNTDGRKG
jgi:Na+/H+ antiporter NhaD/arsenite permease-like protein